MVKMDTYYEILHYLPTSRVDRQYPYDFDQEDRLDGSNVYPTFYQNYNGVDLVEMYVDLPTGVDVEGINITFSPLLEGNANLLTLNALPTEVSEDNVTILHFKVDNNASMVDHSRLLTGIKSLKIDFGEIENVHIHEIIFKSRDFTYTLEDLDSAYDDGLNYVLRALNNRENELDEIKEVPPTLEKYIYMSAGAYAWLTRWEYESKPMKEPKSESNNYADRLLGQVDSAIKRYLSNIENNRDEEYINMDFVATEGVGWGSHYGYWKCKNHKDTQIHKRCHQQRKRV